MTVNAELKRKNQSGALVSWLVNDDGSDPVASQPYAVKITYVGQLTYIAKAAVGTAQSSAAWQAFVIDESNGLAVLWADGNALFDNLATNLPGLNYI